MGKGKIIEEGNWERLMNSKGEFSKMVKRQFFLNEEIYSVKFIILNISTVHAGRSV